MQSSVLCGLSERERQTLSSSTEIAGKSLADCGLSALVWAGKALAQTGISQKMAAIEMGLSESIFSRQIRDYEGQNLSLNKMNRLSLSFWQNFHRIGGADVGVAGYSADVLEDHHLMESFRRRVRLAESR